MASPSTKKRPPLEMEPGEGKVHEMKESPEEEKNEGPEPDDAPQPRSRKRTPKGAKRTKAPMDGECKDCDGMSSGKCAACSKRKAMKDGCGTTMKRSDSLTPQEYLAACELGIQDRSRPYIRARLDAAERLDKKCGKSGIAENKKCKTGGGGNALGNAVKVAAGAAAVGAAGYTAYKLGAAYVENSKRRAHNRRVRRNKPLHVEVSGKKVKMYSRGTKVASVERLNSDVYASGFTIDQAQLAL